MQKPGMNVSTYVEKNHSLLEVFLFVAFLSQLASNSVIALSNNACAFAILIFETV